MCSEVPWKSMSRAVKSGRPRPPSSRPLTVRALIERGARRLGKAEVFYGHGTDNPVDESAALVLHVLGLSHDVRGLYARKVSPGKAEQALALIEKRIQTRTPVVYLTGETWFAGLSFKVDPRVLIPRSPLAELIEQRFEPWVEPSRVRRILDIGTGSGCIAVACAKAFPRARVDAVDISPDALQVARINVRRHRLSRRVRLLQSDHYRALGEERYDIILSNPPYVGAREMRSLPAEYRHEPALALAAGPTGLDSIRVILEEAPLHLRPRGILVVEAGNTQGAVERAYRRLPFLWLSFARGGGGVFLLTAEQLPTKHP